ncbi:MAG: hypothetical protein L3J32_12455, partial [Rhizobiaceae bacterium]|nr:hypothetical protein [Rhizobiaceae bacterium]
YRHYLHDSLAQLGVIYPNIPMGKQLYSIPFRKLLKPAGESAIVFQTIVGMRIDCCKISSLKLRHICILFADKMAASLLRINCE